MTVVSVIAAWLAAGAAVGWWAARRGHWAKLWALTALLGPFALPLVVAAHRRGADMHPRVVAPGHRRRGAVDVLVGVDGSDASLAAGAVAADLFAPRIGRFTLATVLDYDTAAPHGGSLLAPEPWPEEVEARTVLDAGVRAVTASQRALRPQSVVLAGEPAAALERFAVDEGYEVVVVGSRGRGASTLLLGSCAARLSRHPRVPVLVVSPGRGGMPSSRSPYVVAIDGHGTG